MLHVVENRSMGHILRTDSQAPMKQVLFEKGTHIPRIEHTKRVGKPRQKWLEEACNKAYTSFNLPNAYDIENREHMLELTHNAQPRVGVFQTRPKRNKLTVFQ